jgi:hypothetical protein
MSITQEQSQASEVVYDLTGSLLEVCTCGVLCPCWVGEDPDGGSCHSVLSYHFTAATIRGVDVSGRTIVNVVHIPGNVLVPGSWRVAQFIDDGASDEQFEALRDAYSGALGGPLADLAGLVGEVLTCERVRISHQVVDGVGTLDVGDFVHCEMQPFRSADGSITTLRDSIFSTVPGSPAYLAKAGAQRISLPQYDLEWSAEGRNAIQADYRMTYAVAKG